MNKIIISNISFYSGALFVISIIGIFQDIMGKERYIRYVDKHWVDSQPSLILFSCGLIFSLILLNFIKKRIKEENG